MSATEKDIKDVSLGTREMWTSGPPMDAFRQMRAGCPIHWTPGLETGPGGGRLLVGDDAGRHLHDQPRLGDLLLRTGRHPRRQRPVPARALARDVHRHGPAEARPPEGALPARLHTEADRRARGGDPRDHAARARPPGGPRSCDLVNDVAQPVVSRVIGSFMGIDEEEDAEWAQVMNAALAASDEKLNPEGLDAAVTNSIKTDLRALRER